MQKNSSIGLYIHWPFCRSKCGYCNFISTVNCQINQHSWILALLNNLKFYDSFLRDRQIETIFIGGGTPSLIETKELEFLLNHIFKNYKIANNPEITIEANPNTFDFEKMRQISDLGINRVSVGIQSFQDENLKFLTRTYNGLTAKKAIEIVANIFQNYSIDLIYGYDKYEVSNFYKDLQIALQFFPPHISCYQLTFEENTPFWNKMLNGQIIKRDDEEDFLDLTIKILTGNGYFQYEVSNFCKKRENWRNSSNCDANNCVNRYDNMQSMEFVNNMESMESKNDIRSMESINNMQNACRHNLNYWMDGSYIGIGPSAHGRVHFGCESTKFSFENTNCIYEWYDFFSKNGDCGLNVGLKKSDNSVDFSVENITDKFSVDKVQSNANTQIDSKVDAKIVKISNLSVKEMCEELLIVGLRISSGIKFEWIENNCVKEIFQNFIKSDKCKFLKKCKLIESDKTGFHLTYDGIKVMNSVILEISSYLDETL